MSKHIINFTPDTSQDPVPLKNLGLAKLNWFKDWSVKTSSDREVVMSHNGAPLDAPETFRFSYGEVQNMYKNTSLNASSQCSTKKGISLLCQYNGYVSVEYKDATGEAVLKRQLLPVQLHTVIKVPATLEITGDLLVALIARQTAGFFTQHGVNGDRLDKMLRGSLNPNK